MDDNDNTTDKKQKKFDFEFKIIIIGDTGVGKTSILNRFTDDTYNRNYISTIGIDYRIKMVKLLEKITQLTIFDTAGQERYRSLAKSYYKGSQAVIIAYDITDKDSLDSVKSWLSDLNSNTSSDIYKILVGNKIDLEYKREVSYEEAKKFADSLGMNYFEVSAYKDINVNETFIDLTKNLILNHNKDIGEENPLRNSVKIKQKNKKKGKDGKDEPKECKC